MAINDGNVCQNWPPTMAAIQGDAKKHPDSPTTMNLSEGKLDEIRASPCDKSSMRQESIMKLCAEQPTAKNFSSYACERECKRHVLRYGPLDWKAIVVTDEKLFTVDKALGGDSQHIDRR